MPFSPNDSVNLLLKAKVEGQAELKALDAAVKGIASSEREALTQSKALEAALKSLSGNVASLNTTLTDSGNKFKKFHENVKPTDSWKEFAKSAGDFIKNPLDAAGNAATAFLQKLGPVGAGVSVTAGVFLALGKVALDTGR